MKIWVVEAGASRIHGGIYEDNWNVMAFTSNEEATKYCDLCIDEAAVSSDSKYDKMYDGQHDVTYSVSLSLDLIQ